MGRYTGPRSKISRRFGEALFGPDKVLDRRPNPPGQHGARRRKKLSEYGEQLREKQKARFIYGMMERQFRSFFERAKAREGVTGDILLQLCETRLDNIVYRLGLAPTRPAARQLVTHRHVTVDGKMCNIPSAMVKPGQVIGLREKSKSLTAVQDSLNKHRVTVSWLEWNQASQTGSMTSLPERSEIPENINVQAIVELYSR
jgi:small subunit ribosomal protein S4